MHRRRMEKRTEVVWKNIRLLMQGRNRSTAIEVQQ